MKRHRKAPSSAPTTSNLGRLAIALLGACLAVAALGAAAATAAVPTHETNFTCSALTPCGSDESIEPGAVAVDETSGDVYVLDRTHEVIDKFSAAGAFISQSTGKATPPAGAGEEQLAVDNSSNPTTQGSVYFATFAASKVFAFNPAGAFSWERAGQYFCGVDVDSSGHPWAASYEGPSGPPGAAIQLDPAAEGAPTGNAIATVSPCPIALTPNFAFGTAGFLYSNQWINAIEKYDSAGNLLSEAFVPGSNRYLDIDSADGSVYAVHGGASEYEVADYGPSGTERFSFAGPADLRGVAINGASRKIYVTNITSGEIEIWGAPPPVVPTTLTLTASAGGSVSAEAPGTISECTSSGGVCAEELESTPVTRTLVATPEAHKKVTWSGCSAEPTPNKCEVTVNANTAVTATFTAIQRTVKAKVGGKGSLSGSPAGINACTATGGTCEAPYNEGSSLTLTATPDANQQIASWSGCTATPKGPTGNECKLTVPASNAEVSVLFTPITHKLTLTKAGSGTGTLTCDGGACAAEYEQGAKVTLAATAASGSSFAGFSGGGCSASPCTLTIAADTAVTATFNANPVVPPVITTPPVVNPPADNSAAYGQCVAKASKAFAKAKKAAAKKHGKAKAKAIKAAKKKQAKAVAACKAQFK